MFSPASALPTGHRDIVSGGKGLRGAPHTVYYMALLMKNAPRSGAFFSVSERGSRLPG